MVGGGRAGGVGIEQGGEILSSGIFEGNLFMREKEAHAPSKQDLVDWDMIARSSLR